MKFGRLRSKIKTIRTTFQGPKPEYWRSSCYRDLVYKNETPFLTAEAIDIKIDEIKDEILSSSFMAVLIQRLLIIFPQIIWVATLGIFIYILIQLKGNWLPALIITTASYHFLRSCQSTLEKKFDRLQKSILSKDYFKFQFLEIELNAARNSCKVAEKRILDAWEVYCVNYDGYPPDWTERKEAVKRRDRYTCKICGWPTGFKRQRRNLHVHHIRPVAKGGSHGADNLVTLCHICHRKQDGAGHKRIKYMAKPTK